MSEKVGIFRTREALEQALKKVIELKERYGSVGVSSAARHMNYELTAPSSWSSCWKWPIRSFLGAILREESRAPFPPGFQHPERQGLVEAHDRPDGA